MLYEIYRREANTEAGQDQLEYEKSLAMCDAYGGMYFSLRRGVEFNRQGIPVRTEISGLSPEEE